MQISYYIKKRITDIAISTFMLAFLALTLLPIVWMVYSSLKDSTDIAIGKVGLRRAATDVVYIEQESPGTLLVLSADGGLNWYDSDTLKKIRHFSYRTEATAYSVDKTHIWLASANKGLLKISRQDFKNRQRASLNLGRIDSSRVTQMYIKKEGERIYVALDYGRFEGVWEYNAANLRLIKFSRSGKGKLFPTAGQFTGVKLPGVEEDVFCRLPLAGVDYLGASGGHLYKYAPASARILQVEHVARGHLLIRFQNYIDMWKSVNFGLYLRNSLIICGFTMVFAMIFATFAAYALSRFRFPGSDLFSNAILATQMVPMIMYLIPIYIMFVRFTALTGLPVKGTFPGIILIYSAWFLPFSIWILRGFFASIPKELEEAALIDGCSRFRVFWHIALPLAMPGIIATGIYIFLNAWDELMFAWVLTNADTMTIPVGIRLFVGNYQNRFDLMMAAATVATLPVVVLFFLLQRHIVKGLTAGAVKG